MKMHSRTALAAFIGYSLIISTTQAATQFYQTGLTGGAVQGFASPFNPISGTLTAQVPRFNGLLGTLLQADFEIAPQTTASWTSDSAPTGNISISLSGPADVGGQPMGIVPVGFTGTINNAGPTVFVDVQYASVTFTSGAFFNSLTGVGNETMSWIFSGSSSVDVAATGFFDWGGSVHALYTYDPVPEPGSVLLVLVAGVLSLRRTSIHPRPKPCDWST
jgi:hypothetical protein